VFNLRRILKAPRFLSRIYAGLATRSNNAILGSLLLVAIFLLLIWIHRPGRYYFYGDSWDVLYNFLVDWKATVLRPHNEHFIPFFKLLYLLEYKLFRDQHLGYSLVTLALHAGNSTLLFILARQLMGIWYSLCAAILFGFSSIPWEVFTWSFEQGFQVGLACFLAALIVSVGRPMHLRTSVTIAALSIAAYGFAGPLAIVIPLAVSLYVVACKASGRTSFDKEKLLGTLGIIWGPTFLYALVALSLRDASSTLALHGTRLTFMQVRAMIDFTFYGVTQGLLSPTVGLPPGYLPGYAMLVIVLTTLLIASAFFFLGKQRLLAEFWTLLVLLILPILVISLGRSQFGALEALASRYQYFPLAGLAILLALSWDRLANRRRSLRVMMNVAAALLMLIYVRYHRFQVRYVNHGANRAQLAREYVNRMKQLTYPSQPDHFAAVLASEGAVPEYVCAPGYRPDWQILQVLEGNARSVLPVGRYLADRSASFKFNLVRNGGFEAVENSAWIARDQNQLARVANRGRRGGWGLRVELSPRSALTQEVLRSCPEPLPMKLQTTSVYVLGDSQSALSLRLVFQDAAATPIMRAQALEHPRESGWKQLLVSAITPEGACRVSLEVAATGESTSKALIDDAIFVLHPAIIDKAGRAAFDLPNRSASQRH